MGGLVNYKPHGEVKDMLARKNIEFFVDYAVVVKHLRAGIYILSFCCLRMLF
jgi:hypothetical protein